MGMVRIIGFAVLGMILGAILCGIIAVVFDISQREGAYAMGVAFFWMPLGAVIGRCGGALTAMIRR